MKKTKLLSLCLSLALMLGIGSSCANPPGKNEPNDDVPQAADSITTEDTNVISDPVDLSVLTEEEFDVLTEGIIEVLSESNKSDEILVCIFFNETEEEKAIDRTIKDKMANKAERMEQIQSELKELENRYSTLSSGMANTEAELQGTSDLITISAEISELRKELKTYDMGITELRLQMLRDINEPIINDFVERNDIDLTSADHVSYTVSTIYGITFTAEKIVELAQDKGSVVQCIDVLVREMSKGDNTNKFTPENTTTEVSPDDGFI